METQTLIDYQHDTQDNDPYDTSDCITNAEYYRNYEDEELSQSDLHNNLIETLASLIRRIFAARQQQVGIYDSAQLYGDPGQPEAYRSPDLMVIDGLTQGPDYDLTSYYITPINPAPRFIVEAASSSTWFEDVGTFWQDKPAVYERMGVLEYFSIDPHLQPVRTGRWARQGRIIGWRRNPATGVFERIRADQRGRFWSNELQSWLVMEGVGGRELHLYDAAGGRRLTEGEALRAAEVKAGAAEAKAEAQRRRAERLEALLRQYKPDFKDSDLQ